MKQKVWEIQNELKKQNIIDVLLQNRGLTSKSLQNEFFNPVRPIDLNLKDLGISLKEMKKALDRIKEAKEKKEKVIIYGDYDADGVSATAIAWEAVHGFGADVLPYIPDRFKEGYGINSKTIEVLKSKEPLIKLIITVDNGIVANEAIETANKLGIDVIVTDHHLASNKKPAALAIIHTTQIAGSAVAWILGRELGITTGLELSAIGTIADQMPLTFANRSFAKYGLTELHKTKRVGLIELAREAAIKIEEAGTYEVNYIIAPRINSMGRLMHAIDSLRLLCIKDKKRAKELASLVSKTNIERQKIVDEVLAKALKKAHSSALLEGIIFISDEKYHEGVIGLAAGRLVEEFWRPAIVVSKGKKFSKGSARSISGFNIIEAIREQSFLLSAHGGHAMAAGFTIESAKLEEFEIKLNEATKKKLTGELLSRKLKIDCEISFNKIDWELTRKIKEFEPTGIGNPMPTFVTYQAEVVQIKLLGSQKNHLKLKLKKDNKFFDAIGFNMGEAFKDLKENLKIDIAYNIDENEWNGVKSLQLRLKDIKY